MRTRRYWTWVAGLALLLAAGCDATGGADGGPDGAGKPAVLPTFERLDLYGEDSPFNTTIDPDPAIDPASEALVARLLEGGDLLLSVKRYTSPVFFADASTPRVDVRVPCGPEWGLGVRALTGVPVPAWAEPSYDGEPGEGATGDGAVFGCGEGADQDNHMVVVDLERRCEYDFWQARATAEGWEASWAASISLDSTGVYPDGISTRGSGFAFLGGVIWPDELRDGAIEHALAFNYPFTRAGGPVPPATDSDGVTEAEDALPEGARLQLDPDLDLDTLALTDVERAIAEALQVYGMYLVDDSSNGVGLYAVDPRSVRQNPYTGILPDEDWVLLGGIPLDALRVLEMDPQEAGFQDTLAVHESGCGAYD